MLWRNVFVIMVHTDHLLEVPLPYCLALFPLLTHLHSQFLQKIKGHTKYIMNSSCQPYIHDVTNYII